jgi:hypothetical protein
MVSSSVFVGAHRSSVSCTTKPMREWLERMGEVWEVLRGSSFSLGSAGGGANELGGVRDGAECNKDSSNGFVVVEDSGRPTSASKVSAGGTEPMVEVCVTNAAAASGSRIVTLIVPHDLSWQVRL